MDAVQTKPRFHLDLWLALIVQNWLLDVGRPVAMLLLPVDLFPVNRPGPAEYLHLLYSFSSPLILLKFLERSPRMLPDLLVHLGVTAVAVGTSMHLVVDSVTLRLVRDGYELHLSVRENPLLTNLTPSALIGAFELLGYYDDTVGHVMRFVPVFLVLFLFFGGCFCHKKHQQQQQMSTAAWVLLIPNAAYFWYLVTEGQTFILFIFTFFAMTATVMHQRRRGMVPDGNGLFMLLSFSVALVLLLVWSSCLWSDDVLRSKHRGLMYVPQLRAVYTLHLRKLLT